MSFFPVESTNSIFPFFSFNDVSESVRWLSLSSLARSLRMKVKVRSRTQLQLLALSIAFACFCLLYLPARPRPRPRWWRQLFHLDNVTSATFSPSSFPSSSSYLRHERKEESLLFETVCIKFLYLKRFSNGSHFSDPNSKAQRLTRSLYSW